MRRATAGLSASSAHCCARSSATARLRRRPRRCCAAGSPPGSSSRPVEASAAVSPGALGVQSRLMAAASYGNVLEMIGNTPLMAVRRIDPGPCELFLKLENQNPGGSIKDRIGLYLIEAAERAGHIRPGSVLIEATAGNTGLGLALVAAQKGYRLVLAIPDKMSQEKIFHLKAMGAEVVMTRSDVSKGHPEYYRDVAERLARETPDSFFVNQFGNPVNAQAHEETTAPEIWEQMDGRLDALVCGVGTGGTLAGLLHFFARTPPRVGVVLDGPVGSGLASFASTGRLPEKMSPWLVEGIGGDTVPPVADFSRVT